MSRGSRPRTALFSKLGALRSHPLLTTRLTARRVRSRCRYSGRVCRGWLVVRRAGVAGRGCIAARGCIVARGCIAPRLHCGAQLPPLAPLRRGRPCRIPPARAGLRRRSGLYAIVPLAGRCSGCFQFCMALRRPRSWGLRLPSALIRPVRTPDTPLLRSPTVGLIGGHLP